MLTGYRCLAPLALTAVLAGCGGSSQPRNEPLPTGAVASAQAINLRTGDLPAREWRQVERAELRTLHKWPNDPLANCTDPLLLLTGVEDRSPSFHGKGREYEVRSSVVVLSSRALATQILQRAERCEAKPPTETFSGARQKRIFKHHVLLGLRVFGTQFPVPRGGSSDQIMFVLGRAQVTLTAYRGESSPPFPSTTEQRLISLLASRAIANKIG